MVVQLDETLYPNVEDVLMAYLASLAETDTEPPVDDDGIGIQVNRVGGSDDGITDYPRVIITCHHPDPRGASKLARQVQQRMANISGIDIVVDDEPKPICVDFCRTDTPPESEPYENPDQRTEVAYYVLGLQRPRP
ncbi:hypothetical protein R3Q06_30730 [Rhodococcus erythropolis]|uniref:hypothetical protein n=1 Tax=Rhodococcus erythropolis TaxID=1833 RepID=UPI00294A07C8|nr:hypothetical protein [Rhodococcus erythropolis]MDV6277868.1 hypothetical protein [Rhodococcus erythropolis]